MDETVEINEKKVLSFLGIARKAGALTIGGFLSFAAVKDKKAKMLIVATDASDNTKLECEKSKSIKKLTVLELFTKDELGAAFGKAEVSVIGITKKDFSDNIKRMTGIEINGGDAK